MAGTNKPHNHGEGEAVGPSCPIPLGYENLSFVATTIQQCAQYSRQRQHTLTTKRDHPWHALNNFATCGQIATL